MASAREQMNRLAEDMDEGETAEVAAEVAAEILSTIEITPENLESFSKDLGDEFKEALYKHLHSDLGK